MTKNNDRTFLQLYQILADIHSAEEIAAFLEDLCTITELEAFAQRLDVMRCLDSGMNYAQITRATGVSSATITRVNRCLQYGVGGYRIALEKMKKDV